MPVEGRVVDAQELGASIQARPPRTPSEAASASVPSSMPATGVRSGSAGP
ncbi:hypothetical protein ACFSSF_12525 [Dietzia aerolata]